MRTTILSFLLGATGLFFTFAPTSVRAGTAIVTDNHGGYAYKYGHFSKQELVSRAFATGRQVSSHPGALHLYFYTPKHGYGTILRYYIGKQQHVVGTAGCATAARAHALCMQTVRQKGGSRVTVRARWLEE